MDMRINFTTEVGMTTKWSTDMLFLKKCKGHNHIKEEKSLDMQKSWKEWLSAQEYFHQCKIWGGSIYTIFLQVFP